MANEKLDLIDRKKVLENLDKFVNPMPDENGCHYLSGLATAITEIVEAPSVDAVEVVHAEWVWKDGCFHCTNCKQTEDHITKYCHGCGAKMDGGNEDV